MNDDQESAFKDYLKWREELHEMIQVKDDCIVVNVKYEYVIPLNRCKTREGILGWVFQLSEKTWMTRDLLRHFIIVAHGANNLEIPHP